MIFLRPYVIFCVLVVGLFAWARYEGRSLADSTPQYGSSRSGGAGGVYYTGTSGGSHK